VIGGEQPNWGAVHFRQLPRPDGMIERLQIVFVVLREFALGSVVHDGKWFMLTENNTRPTRFADIGEEVSQAKMCPISWVIVSTCSFRDCSNISGKISSVCRPESGKKALASVHPNGEQLSM